MAYIKKTEGSLRKDVIGICLFLMFLVSFLFTEQIKQDPLMAKLPKMFVQFNTIFLSIIIETIPFILLGVFISSFIQTFVSEKAIAKFIPKKPIMAIVPAILLGFAFPLCECAIVPVVRRLIKKGLPLHIGAVLLISTPILNPVVLLSTYFAFRNHEAILYARMGLAIFVAAIVGTITYFFFKNRKELKWSKEELAGEAVSGATRTLSRWKQTFYHASDEFFDTGKYIIIGAFLASLFQTFFNRNFLLSIGTDDVRSTGLMMGLSFLLSICSEADAFIAASFGTTFSKVSLIAFLVYGPILDIKNALMLFATFNTRFVLAFISIVTVVVFFSALCLKFIL
ncbi:permease [Fictibacillus sp. Mic-4]|uniref:permease n=1 Tax=Fictibacillus sp. Mic-4 TaxID=3132826 RepID=UPI003CEB7D83